MSSNDMESNTWNRLRMCHMSENPTHLRDLGDYPLVGDIGRLIGMIFAGEKVDIKFVY